MNNGAIMAIVVLVIVVLIGATSQFYLGPDNKLEEETEVLFKEETGIDIDFSPDTPENNKANAILKKD